MGRYPILTATYEKDGNSVGQICLEGFGPETIVGAVRDTLNGVHNPEGAHLTSIRIDVAEEARQGAMKDWFEGVKV